MIRILAVTLLLHLALNGLLTAAYATLLDDEVRQAISTQVNQATNQAKALIPWIP
jgi:hypothetical protein